MPQDLLQAPYCAAFAQGVCDPVQVCGIVPIGEAVALFGKADCLPRRLIGHVLVAVEDDHSIERGMATHTDGQMTPVSIPDMEVVMVDEGIRFLSAKVDAIVAIALDVPYGGRGRLTKTQKIPVRVGSVGRCCSPMSCFRSPDWQ